MFFFLECNRFHKSLTNIKWVEYVTNIHGPFSLQIPTNVVINIHMTKACAIHTVGIQCVTFVPFLQFSNFSVVYTSDT